MPSLNQTNVTDATRAEYYRKALATKRELEEAQEAMKSKLGVHRSMLKEAKKAGVDTEALTRVLAARLEDPEVVMHRDQEYIRMLVIAGVMPKEQLTMFSEMFPDLTKQELDGITSERVYDDGFFSGSEGRTRTTNPHPPGSDHADVWDRAWIAGQKKIADGMPSARKMAKPPRKGKVMAEAAE